MFGVLSHEVVVVDRAVLILPSSRSVITQILFGELDDLTSVHGANRHRGVSDVVDARQVQVVLPARRILQVDYVVSAK
ncbi:hypothetical protein D3C72_1210110 [compost metagenome]